MSKLLVFLFSACIACTTYAEGTSPFRSESNDMSGNISGVRNNTKLPLVIAIQGSQSQSVKKSFQSNEVEGWFQDNSEWFIKGVVNHHRLRCATYELGVRLGKGNPSCLNVEWLTDVYYGTTRRQCNNAPLQHVGGGEIPELSNTLIQATCVQIVIKCTGACG